MQDPKAAAAGPPPPTNAKKTTRKSTKRGSEKGVARESTKSLPLSQEVSWTSFFSKKQRVRKRPFLLCWNLVAIRFISSVICLVSILRCARSPFAWRTMMIAKMSLFKSIMRKSQGLHERLDCFFLVTLPLFTSQRSLE